MSTKPNKMRRLTGGFAIGLGLGVIGLAFVAFQNPSIPLDFAGATALIGLFCMAIGRVCMSEDPAPAPEMEHEVEAAHAA